MARDYYPGLGGVHNWHPQETLYSALTVDMPTSSAFDLEEENHKLGDVHI